MPIRFIDEKEEKAVDKPRVRFLDDKEAAEPGKKVRFLDEEAPVAPLAMSAPSGLAGAIPAPTPYTPPVETRQNLANQLEAPLPVAGPKSDLVRRDGSGLKGKGYLGAQSLKDGRVASELSMGTTDINGAEMDIPTMVPTLTQPELDWLLTHEGERLPESISRKATDHARERLKQGKSVWAQEGEQGGVAPTPAVVPPVPGGLAGAAPEAFVPPAKPERSMLENLKEETRRGDEGVLLDMEAFKAWQGTVPWEEVKKKRDEFKARVEADPVGKDAGFLERAVYGTGAMAPPMLRGIEAGAELGLLSAGGALIAGQIPPLTAMPEEIATVPLAYGAGSAVGQFEYWSRQGTGQIYGDLRDAGVSDKTAKWAAPIGGLPYAAIEFSQVDKIFPGLGRKAKTFAKQSLMKGLLRLAAKLGVNTINEVGEEGVQQVTTDTVTAVGKYIDGQLKKEDVPEELRQIGANAWQAVYQSLGPMGLLQLPGATVGAGRQVTAARGQKQTGEVAANLQVLLDQSGDPAARRTAAEAIYNELLAKDQKAAKAFALTAEKILTSPPIPVNPEAAAQAAQAPAPVVLGPTPEQVLADPAQFEQGREQAAQYLRGEAQAARTAGERAEAVRYRGMANAVANSTPETYPAIFAGIEAEFAQGSLVRRTQTGNERFQQQTATGLLGATAEEIQQADQTIAARENLVKTLAQAAAVRAQAPIKAVQGDAAADDLNYQILQAKANGTPDLTGPATPTQKTVTPSGDLTPEVSPVPDLQQPQPQEVSDAVKTGREPTGDRAKYPGAASRQNIPADQAQDGVEKGAGAERGDRAGGVAEGQVGAGERVLVPAEPAKYRVHKGMVAEEVAKRRAQLDHKIVSARKGLEYIQANTLLQNRSDAQRQLVGAIDKLMQKRDAITPAAVESELYADRVKRVKRASKASIKRYPSEIARAIMPKGLKPNADAVEEFDEHIPAHYRNDKTGAPIDVALDELRTGVEDERGVQVQGGLLRKDAGLKELGAMLRENDRLAGMKQADIEEETPESILNQQGVDEQKWFEHESEVVDQANINDGDTVQVHGRTLTAKETKEGIELSDGTVLPIVDAGDPAGQMRIDLIDGKSSLRRKADLVLEAKKDEIDAEQNRRDAAVEKQAREDAAEEKRVEAAKAKELEKQAQVIPGMPAKKSRLMPVKKSLLGEAPPGGWTLWDKTPEAVRKSADLTTTDGESRVLPGAPEVRYTVRKRDGEIRVSFFRDKPTQLSVYAEGSTVEGAFDAAWTSFAGKARKIQVAKPAAAEGVAQSTAGMSPDLAYQTEYQNYLLGLSKKAPSPPANLEPFVIENLQRAAKQGAQAIESRPVKKSKLPPKVKERAAGPGPATWTPLGDAYAGGQIETDDNGVRSVVKDGIRRTQPVRMIPSKDGVHSGFDSPDLLFKKDSLDYLTKKEVAEFRSQIQFKATDKEDRTETVKAESNTDKQQPWDTKAGDIYDGPDGGNTYVFSKETKLKEARKIVEVLKEQGLQARVNAWLGKRPDGSTQKMPLSHWDVLVDNVSESLSKQLDRLRAVKAGEVKPATEDRPETGKQYSLSEISKGKTWAEAEFTSEKHREDFVAKLINGRATKDGVMYRMRAVKEGEYTYDVQRTSAGEWELNKETWSSRPAAADMAAVEAFGAKREKSKMPPSKTVNAVEVDILKQSGIPKAEVSDYISDTVANGAALRKHAEAVNTGKETVEDAAKAITGDWETKQVESVVKPAEAPRPAVKSPVANLSDADQAKMKALQAAMRKKLLGQVSIGLDPEVLTLSAQMAELYVKGGVKTFNQFAANVKTDMADMWDKVKAYLHSAWQAAGATDNTLDDVNRADAAAAVAELDQEAAPAEEVAPEVPSKLPEPKSQQVADVAPGMQIVEQFHSKRGKNVYIVTMADRVERDAYQRLAAQARMLGGKWSREWKPTHSPAGFMFNRREQAETFVNSNQETPVPAKAKLPPGQSAIAKAFQEGGRGAVLPDRGVKGSGVTTTTPKETDLFSLQSSEEGIDSIVGREARRDSSKQDEGSGTEALAGTPSEDVSADAEGGVVGQTPDRSGGVDTEGVKRPDRQERPGRPGVGDGEGKLPAPAVRRGRAKPGRDAVVQQPTRNFRITDDTVLGAGTPAARISNNLAAIRLAKQLTAEGSLPTPAEQAVLIQYVGWGGLPGMFEKHLGWAWTALQDKETPTAEREGTGTKDPLWSKHKELRELITPEEYDAAEGSTLNAHYTSPDVISGMYSALEHFGFKGGRMLETSAGIGHFIGLQPDFSRKTTWAAVEKDTITGMILKLLYPDASVNVRGYEKTPLPDNFFDVIMSNVPFGSFQVSDPKYDKHKFMIHDYFFAKSLDKVRPGGMVAFITSAGTMDKLNDSMRNYVSKNGGQFIGAIRLPNTAFKGNAGTEVVTDVIFIRKVMPGEKVDNSAWDTISDVSVKDKDGDKVDISVNDYFKKNRDMVLGKLTAQGSMYTANEMTVVGKAEGLGDRIAEAAQKLPADIITDPVKDSSKKLRDAEAQEPIAAPTDLLEGNLTIHNGKVMIKVGENLESVKFPKGSKDASAKVTRMIVMRTAARKVLQTQHKDEAGTVIQDAMDELNKAYDYFVKHHGFVHAKENKDIILEDTADASLIFALETWKEESKTGVKTDIFTKRLIVPKVRPETAANIKDAASISLNETGALDFDRIAELLKMDRVVAEDQALKEGLAFRNPENDTIESRGEYLSGFVRRKLDVAQAAADQDPQFKANTEALVPVQPKWKEHGAIGTKMGSSWVSADTYKEFLADLLDISEGRLQIDHNEHSGAWNIQASRKYGMNAKESSTYGVSQRNNAYWILDRLFNGKAMTIWETASDGSKSINIAQTALAKQRAELIQNEFNKWLWADERRTEMETRFNNIMNGFVPREWDGSGLSLDGMSSVWQAKLAAPDREFQKNGIARGVQGGNMLMAWEVGAGKTIAMAATGMEMRRLGLVRKPLYVVPNHMLEQWAGEFREAYPLAKLLLARPEDLDSKEKRKAFVARTATGDWDGVLIRRSTFKMIGVSRDTELAYINDEMAQLRESYDQARSNQQGGRETRAVKQLRAAMERLQVKIDRLMKAESKDVGLTFEDMGADMLFVDEAHNYKGLMLKTGREPIPGLTHQPSQTAMDLEVKARYINQLHAGKRGLVFATGTPITNTIGEMYVLMRFLAPKLLSEHGVSSFDDWANMFGLAVSRVEMNPTGQGYRSKSRFAAFVNMGPLKRVFRSFADVVTKDDLKIPIPAIKTGKPQITSVPKSEWQKEYIDTLVKRAEAIKNGGVDPKDDNMLVVTNDGRKVALDERLIDPSRPDNPNSKLNEVVKNVFATWDATSDVKGTQLVFSDLGVPGGSTFDVYAEIKSKLIEMGVPESEIAFIHDAKTGEAKAQLFAKVRAGEVRVLIGNTMQMGEGTNVQTLLAAVHHVDVPWKPAWLTQRNGRILRPGNMNKEVEVKYYATEGSFDVYMWQTVERKARFIAQAMNSDMDVDKIEDVDETVLTAEMVKAIASGDPLVIEQATLGYEFQELYAGYVGFQEGQNAKFWELQRYEKKINEEELKNKAASVAVKQYDTKRPEEFPKPLLQSILTKAAEIGKVKTDKEFLAQKIIAGEYAGFPVELRGIQNAERAGDRIEYKNKIKLTVNDGTVNQVILDVNPILLEGDVKHIPQWAGQHVSSLKNIVNDAEAKMADLNKQLDEIKKESAGTYPRVARLHEVEARLEEINAQLGGTQDDHQDTVTDTDDDAPADAGDQTPAQFSLAEDAGRGMSRADAVDAVNAAADLIGPASVVQSEADLPAAVRAQAAKKGYTGRVKAVEWQGEVYVVADNVKDARDAQAEALHEAFHAGFDKAFTGAQRTKILNSTLTKFGRVMELAAIARKYNLDLSNEADSERAMEELIAKITRERTSKPKVWSRFVGAIRQALRDMGLLKTMSDEDIDYLIERALAARGKGGRQAEGARRRMPASRTERAKFGLADKARAAAPVWYSRLERAIAGVKMPKMSLDQLAAATKQNVDAEERKWTGFDEWIQAKRDAGVKSVTKEEALAFVRENAVQIKEVVKDANQPTPFEGWTEKQIREHYDNIAGENRDIDADELPIEEIKSRIRTIESEFSDIDDDAPSAPKFATYQTPGGENYRELLLALPGKLTSRGRLNQEQEDRLNVLLSIMDKTDSENAEQRKLLALDNADFAEGKNRVGGVPFMSPHWSEPNVLAHVRMNDRWTSVDGTSYTPPQKTLFIEEVQSDWHQQGKKQGYQVVEGRRPSDITKLPPRTEMYVFTNTTGTYYQVIHEGEAGAVSAAYNVQQEAIDDAWRSIKEYPGIPDAPFKTTWPMLAMRRMIQYAAANGYDRIAWTTGEMQAKRYPDELRKVADQIEWNTDESGIKEFFVKKDGGTILSGLIDSDTGLVRDATVDKANGKKPDEIFGKGMSAKVAETADGKIEGKDFTIGAEGMKGFYDQILPNEVNKFVKKWGGRVGETVIGVAPKSAEDAARHGEITIEQYNLAAGEALIDVPFLDITPSMRESVQTEGVPKFSLADQASPEGYAPADQPAPSAAYADVLQMLDKYLPQVSKAATMGHTFGKALGKEQAEERSKKERDKARDKFDEKMKKVREAAKAKREKDVLAARIGERGKGRKEAIKTGMAIGFERGEAVGLEQNLDKTIKAAFTDIHKGSKRHYLDTLRSAATKLESAEANKELYEKLGKTPEQVENMQDWVLGQIFGPDQYREIRRIAHKGKTPAIIAVRDLLQKELSTHYVRELALLIKKTNPDKLGSSLDNPKLDFKAQWKEAIEAAPEFSKKNWVVAKDLYEHLTEIITDNRNAHRAVSQGKRYEIQANALLAANVISENFPEIKSAKHDTPKRRGRGKYILVDKTGNSETRGLTMSDGDPDGIARQILDRDIVKAETESLEHYQKTIQPVLDEFKRQGLSDFDLIDMATRRRAVLINGKPMEILDGKGKPFDLELTDFEKISLAANWQDEGNKVHTSLAGFMQTRLKGQGIRIWRETPGETAEMVESIIDTMTPGHKAIATLMVDKVTGMGTEANKVSEKLDGYSIFISPRYWMRSVDRTTTKQAVDMDGTARDHHNQSLQGVHFKKERQEHTHPLMIGNAWSEFREHAFMMSKYTKMSLAAHDAIALIGDPEFAKVVRTHLGSRYLYDTRDTIMRASGLRGYKSDNLIKSWLDAGAHNVAVSILWLRSTSYIYNRVGGSILAATELFGKDPKTAARFLARTVMPVMLHTANGKEVVKDLMTNGFLKERLSGELARVYAPLPSERAGDMTASKFKMWWRKMQQFGLRNMAHAELRNAVAIYKAMMWTGYSKADAIQAAEDITRSTQNPSSDLQSSPLYLGIKDSGFGFLVPFLGQPMVSRNIMLRDMYFLHHALKAYKLSPTPENRKKVRHARVKLAMTILGLAGNIAMRMIVLTLLGKLRRPPDDDEDKAAEQRLLWNIGIAANDTMDMALPGTGRLADGVMGAIQGKQPRDMSLFGGVVRSFSYGVKNLIYAYDKEDLHDADMNEEKLWAGIADLLEMSASLAGGPVGGPMQVGRIAKNLLSE